MATKNDITGDNIASRVATQSYRDGWDAIFAKKTAEQWLKDSEFEHVSAIIDPEGWRMDDTRPEATLTRAEFSRRLNLYTLLVKQKNDSH